jgi:predicted GNAT family N-acyltransferase
VATLAAYRGKGFGRAVMQALIKACCIMGGERQILHAQLHARKFYEDLGFTAYGEEFEEAGIPHICMEHHGWPEGSCAHAAG